eukprot:c25610_g1_i1.p1 GENE.c25610_g1_i1~~c25610_g1_i1.p1  ORF type:complete len:311 (+),score=35.93 c25610_g1_i1:53-934(+)
MGGFLLGLPDDVWLEHILTSLDVFDIISWSAVSKDCHRLAHATTWPIDNKKGDVEVRVCDDKKRAIVKHAKQNWERIRWAVCLHPDPHENDAEKLRQTLWELASINLHRFEMTQQSITDLSMFAHIHTLIVNFCDSVTDVSALGDVHTLDLSHSVNLSDISPLSNVHTLSLRGCRLITDVSPLAKVHTLNLAFCHGITDVSPLRGVYSLDLSQCRGFTNVNMLGSVHELFLRNCMGISDVSGLGTCHTLNLCNCHLVTDISMLGNVQRLTIMGCSVSEETANTYLSRVPVLRK